MTGLSTPQTNGTGAVADGRVATNVVRAVAAARDVDPVDLDERLHDHVDPEALDAVVRSIDDGHVTFAVAGHRVRVDADGAVTVDA